MTKRSIFLMVSFMLLACANEPSVYGAGNINSSQPYGLTETEQSVLDNRRQIQLLKNMVVEQQSKIDGLTSIVEGLNQQIMQLREQLDSTNVPADDYNKTYSLLLDLGNMIDQINSTYVTQEDLRLALQGRGGSATSQQSGAFTNVSRTYREGVQLFSRKSYQAAKEKFEATLAQNYKPAASNYYLGEIAYYTNDYNGAIAHFKKSASLYDKANYMPVLYLHTGIALARTGEKDQARSFFQFVVDHYPDTKSAKIARKNL